MNIERCGKRKIDDAEVPVGKLTRFSEPEVVAAAPGCNKRKLDDAEQPAGKVQKNAPESLLPPGYSLIKYEYESALKNYEELHNEYLKRIHAGRMFNTPGVTFYIYLTDGKFDKHKNADGMYEISNLVSEMVRIRKNINNLQGVLVDVLLSADIDKLKRDQQLLNDMYHCTINTIDTHTTTGYLNYNNKIYHTFKTIYYPLDYEYLTISGRIY